MKENKMTLDQFLADLPHLDWYYEMSDDHQVYLRGSARVRRYRDLAIAMGGEWQDAFNEQNAAHKI